MGFFIKQKIEIDNGLEKEKKKKKNLSHNFFFSKYKKVDGKAMSGFNVDFFFLLKCVKVEGIKTKVIVVLFHR